MGEKKPDDPMHPVKDPNPPTVVPKREPGIKEEPNPEPPVVVRKGPVVTLYGSVDHGDMVMVHGDVERERRVMPIHRQEFLRHADDVIARQEWIAGLLASAPQPEPNITDPWQIAGKVKLVE